LQNIAKLKTVFLWIKNIWKQDTTTNAILTYEEFNKINNGDTKLEWANEFNYNLVMDSVDTVYGGANGYFLLIFLCCINDILINAIINIG
jgi:hypothetical protein